MKKSVSYRAVAGEGEHEVREEPTFPDKLENYRNRLERAFEPLTADSRIAPLMNVYRDGVFVGMVEAVMSLYPKCEVNKATAIAKKLFNEWLDRNPVHKGENNENKRI